MTKGEQAKALFESGCNCAQAVAGCFYEEMGLSQETVFLLASAFGGGISRLRETCGAVSGMMLVLGAVDGYLPVEDETTHTKEKTRVYETGQLLVKQFQKEFGTLLCRELLGEEGTVKTSAPSPRTTQYYQERPCARFVAYAAERVDEYLKKKTAETILKQGGTQ